MKIALVGNPNSGKTSLFNQLTGLNQKVGNYPGITVDKKTGSFLYNGSVFEVLDLPGAYSVYPRSRDEEVVSQILTDRDNKDFPDLVVVTVDAANLERNLLLHTQIYDLGMPVILAVNMVDIVQRQGTTLDYEKLSELLGGIPVKPIVARTGQGIAELKSAIANYQRPVRDYPINAVEFANGQLTTSHPEQKAFCEIRYKKIGQILSFCLQRNHQELTFQRRHYRADKILTHPVFGYLIFLGVLMLIFQAIYAWSDWPMNAIDSLFLGLSQATKQWLPPGIFTNLLAEGIIPGLGGVLIFIPQIAILFTFIFILEETGYMSRVAFIMDRLMRPFGLNGRSIVPMISGVACAIPAILATRTIDNWKERLITIMVTPLMSCSARLPVYAILIALVIPDRMLGPFNLQGLTLLGLYLMGFVAAMLSAMLFRVFIKTKERSFLILELPFYKVPRWKNLGITIYEKVKIFTFEAGRVILAISVILWVLATFGPGDRIQNAVSQIPKPANPEENVAYQNKVDAVSLENSYIGIIGHTIEPAIRPLGFNWQIGIALVTSFAAREVFVGTMATIYSVGEDFEEDRTLIERMRGDISEATGRPVYGLATGLALMIFYAFAMQCMSTLAVVLRETKSWKWPLIQLAYLTILAYGAAFVTYQLLA